MEIFSALLVLCEGNSLVTGEFLSQRLMTRIFGVFFNLCLNKRLSKPSRRRWFDTPSRSLWRQCNEASMWPYGTTRCRMVPFSHVLRDPFKSIISIIFCAIYEAYQFILWWLWESVYFILLSPLFTARSWNNGMRCMSCYVFIVFWYNSKMNYTTCSLTYLHMLNWLLLFWKLPFLQTFNGWLQRHSTHRRLIGMITNHDIWNMAGTFYRTGLSRTGHIILCFVNSISAE